ncbi:MAG: class I SAM-dependent methyltransferase [Candidatus Binatia bacterium]
MYKKSYKNGWFLNFLPIWYATHRLKQIRNMQNWDDNKYYKNMYSLPFLTHDSVGDKLANVRDAITDEILKDKTSSRVVDLATGRGYQARNIWCRGYKNVHASDFHAGRVAEAKEQNSDTDIRFETADMKELPYRDAIFDAITISGALHDLKSAEIERSLNECRRILKTGGRLIIMEPRCLGDIPYVLIRKVYSYGCNVLDESVNMQDFLDFDIAGFLTTLGFTLVKKQTVWYSILCIYTFEKLHF